MHDTDLAAVGALIGDPSRARMLDALMGGRALTASELARIAGVGASTASEHLARLRDGGLVAVVAQGRHRYYRIAGPEVGAALEALSHVAPPQPVTSLRQAGHAQALGFARTCYDHLAGRCGVALHDALRGARLAHRGRTTSRRPATDGAASALGRRPWRAVRARRRYLRPCRAWTGPSAGRTSPAAWRAAVTTGSCRALAGSSAGPPARGRCGLTDRGPRRAGRAGLRPRVDRLSDLQGARPV